jgi:CheY-specific phosphatase CheX
MSTLQKGEVSLEFITLIGIMLVIFTSMIIVIGLNNRDVTESMIYSEAERIADIIASEINTAARIRGYYREFKIPEKIAGIENYSVSIDKSLRMVQVKWKDNSEFSNIVTGNISGTVSPGKNKIRNEEELIIIES